MVKELRVGVIGYGFMGMTRVYGYQTLRLYYRDLPFRVKLVGVCNPTLAKAERAKEDFGFAYSTDDWREIVNDPQIDIVNICSPNIYHREQVLAALGKGKHVFCDKPLAVSAAEAEEIAAAAQGKGLVCQVALQNRFFPVTMRAKQILEEGRLGRILSFRASYLHSGSVDPDKPIGWKQDQRIGGGGVLFDLGSHVLDMVYYLLGEFEQLTAATQVLYPQRPDRNGRMVDITADDAAYLLCRMRSGAMGTVEASKAATGVDDELRVELHGDRGALRFNLMDPNYLEFFDNRQPETPLGGYRGFTRIACLQRFDPPGGAFVPGKMSIGWMRSHVHCLYHFLDCVNRNAPASPSFAEGAYIQRVMEAGYASSKEGGWVRV